MKNKLRIRLFTLLFGSLLMGLTFSSYGQLQITNHKEISNPDPELITNRFSKNVPTLTFLQPDVEALLIEDEARDKNGQFYRIGVGIDVDITTQNSGLWTTLPNGNKVWRLKVKYPGAKSMSFIFSKFHLYGESTINVYNPQGEKVHLTYTKDDVLDHGQQNMSLCSGDYLMLELIEPVGSPASLIEMEKLFYSYRSSGMEGNEQKINESDPCQVNVNCSPEGNNWQDEKRGVARIVMIMGYYQGLCTGSLINNTSQDCKPYFLTAMHCGEGATQSDFNNWRFYFNYEASGCANPTSSSQVPNQYISSCQKIAGSEDVNGNTISKSDFLLVKMGTSSNESSIISTLKSWNAYWNGWDANNTASPQGVGIHHPSGDIKKISTYTTTLQSTTYSGINQNTHWRVYWSATTNGHGVTEGGSSGSPLFNYNGGNSRIVGKLSGGTSYCTNTNGYDLYGKFSYSWTSAGNTNATRLKPWLDPGNTGLMVLDGSSDPCTPTTPNPPNADFVADQTNVYPGTTVNFTDLSTNGPTSWSWSISPGSGWSYTGGTSSTTQHPKVNFTGIGSYTVTLTATNTHGSDSETKTNYIIVGQTPAICDTLTNMVPSDGNYIYSFQDNGGYVFGNNYIPTASLAERFSNSAPTYITGTGINFIVADYVSNNSKIVVKVWSDASGAPGTVLHSQDVYIKDIAPNISGNNFYQTLVHFDQPVSVSGDFFVGFDLSLTAGDTVTVACAQEFTSNPSRSNSAWFYFNNNNTVGIPVGWYEGDDLFQAGFQSALHIYPWVTTVPPKAVVTATPTTVCAGSTVQLDASGSTNMSALEWLVPGGTPTAPTGTNPTVTMNQTGQQVVYLLVENSCGFYHIDSLFINVQAQPTVGITADNTTICSNETAQLNANATGATSYSWSPSAGLSCTNCPNPVANPTTTTTYTLVVSNGSCTATDNITILVNDGTITANFTVNSTTVCVGDVVSFDGSGSSGADTYSWTFTGGSPSSGSGVNATTTYNTPGTYTAQLNVSNSCNLSDATTQQINVVSGVEATVNAVDASCGNSNGSITINASGGGGNYQYSIDGGQTNSNNNTFNNLLPGTYQVVVSSPNGGCGDYTETVVVGNAVSSPITVGANQTICDGESTVLFATGNGSIEWFVNGVLVGTGPTLTVSPTSNTTYTATLTDNDGCTDSGTIEVTVIELATATFSYSSTEFCQNEGTISPTFGSGSIAGAFSSTSGLTINSSTGEIDLTSSQPGTYTVENTVDNGFCASVSDTYTITIKESPAVDAGDDVNVCEGDDVTLTATGADSYSWSNNVVNGVPFTPNIGTVVYTVTGTGVNGCTNTDQVTVTVTAYPVVNAGPDQTACSGETLILTAASNGGTITWDNGIADGTPFQIFETTTFTVTADNNGCISTDEVTITVILSPTVDAGNDDMTICNNAEDFALNDGSPQGGSFSGNGVTNNIFSPAQAGAGIHEITYSYTNQEGCTGTATFTIQVDDCLGVNENDMFNLVISPNPASNKIEVNYSGNAEIQELRMLTVEGQSVQMNTTTINENSILIDVSRLASGPYFIQVVTTNGLITKKVIIQ